MNKKEGAQPNHGRWFVLFDPKFNKFNAPCQIGQVLTDRDRGERGVGLRFPGVGHGVVLQQVLFQRLDGVGHGHGPVFGVYQGGDVVVHQ